MPDVKIKVQTDDVIFPEERANKIAEIIELKKNGLLNAEQAQMLLEPMLGIDLTLVTPTTPAPVVVPETPDDLARESLDG